MLRRFLIQTSRFTSSSTAPKISIPYAIKRTPTELLEALNSTVGTDVTAPHFGFIDDPLTIPSIDRDKMRYFHTRELGKRAARQLAAEWSTLFMYDIDEPRLPVFRPKQPRSARGFEATEEELIDMINEREVTAAVECFDKMRSNGTVISDKVQMDLFKLVVYYNQCDIPTHEIEEFHSLRNTNTNIEAGPWFENGLGELLFETTEKTPETYSIMIAGLCKYPSEYSLEKARRLYGEMLNKKMVPTVEVFNSLISVSEPNKSLEYLKKMNELKVQPNVETLNNYIEKTTKKMKYEERLVFIQKAIYEFKLAGVEANLSTYTSILYSLTPTYESKKPENCTVLISVLDQIVRKLEDASEIKIKHPYDADFFTTAMSIAVDNNNADLVERIEGLYSSKKNTVKLTNFAVEGEYYKKYLFYNVLRLPLDELEVLYKKLVPRVCDVHSDLLDIIVNRLASSTPKWSFVKRLISDYIASSHIVFNPPCYRVQTLFNIVNTDKLSPQEFVEFKELLSNCMNIWKNISELNEQNKFKNMSSANSKFFNETKRMFSKYLEE